nr:helix-turn-helix domain-containing protein [Cupriavidus sp. amp6]
MAFVRLPRSCCVAHGRGVRSDGFALEALAALAHSIRLSVFRMLVQASPSGLPAGRIAELMEMPASSLSFHVKELHRAGLLSQSPGLVARSFTWPHSETMNALQAYLPETCGGGKPCSPVSICSVASESQS